MTDGRATAASPLNVHFQHLAYLREAARAGGVTRAAERLHVTQPALSQALAELERRLGVALFERAGRGRRLTVAGAEVLAFAERVLTDAEGLSRLLAAYGRGHGGVLRAGMIDAAGIYLLPEVIRDYRAALPDVELRVSVDTSGVLLRRLRAGELDLIVVVDGGGEPDLVAVEIAREPLHWYAPVGDQEEPQSAQWALYPEGSRTRRLIDEGFARAGIRPVVTLESGNPEVLRQMAALGLGWTVLPAAVVAPGDVALRVGAQVAERRVHIAWRRSAPEDARTAEFVRRAVAWRAGQTAKAVSADTAPGTHGRT